MGSAEYITVQNWRAHSLIMFTLLWFSYYEWAVLSMCSVE